MVRQTALGLTDDELSEALGFDRKITLTLIKTGSMRLPLTKIPPLAAALGLEPIDLFRVAAGESSPDLLRVIEEAYDPLHLTATEITLITHLRGLCGSTPVGPIVFDGKTVIALVAA